MIFFFNKKKNEYIERGYNLLFSLAERSFEDIRILLDLPNSNHDSLILKNRALGSPWRIVNIKLATLEASNLKSFSMFGKNQRRGI